MDMRKLKLAGYLTIAAVAAIGSGYGWARTVHKPAIVEITSTACGVPAATPEFGLPLQSIVQVGGGLRFGVGPLDVPEGGGLISLWFDPSADGQAREVLLSEDRLHLPMAFGRDRETPRRITISCRDGQIGTVRYYGEGRASTSFTVVREANTAMLWGGFAGGSSTSATVTE